MKIVITNRKFETSDKLKNTIERKMAKLDRFFPDEVTAGVTLSTRGKVARVEITIFYKGTVFRTEEENKEYEFDIPKEVERVTLPTSFDIEMSQYQPHGAMLEEKLKEYKLV